MLRTINALKARRNLGQLLEEVFYKGDQFVIQRAGKSMAVVISPSEYEAYRKQREKDMVIFSEIRKKNKGAELEDLEKDVQKAIEAVGEWVSEKQLTYPPIHSPTKLYALRSQCFSSVGRPYS